MSSWSSFEKDKIATDAWRSYLNEWRGVAPDLAGATGMYTPNKKAPEEEEEEEETSPDEEGADEAAFIPVPSPFAGSGPWKEDPTASDPESPELVDAEEEAEDSTESSFADKVQVILDALGVANLIPGGQIIGTPATVASLLLNLGRKKYNMALLDVLGLVPIAGGAAKAGKLGKTAAAAAKMKKVAMAIDKAEKFNKPILIQRAFNSLLHEFKDTKIFDIVDGVLETVSEHGDTDIGPFKERWEERKKDYINYKKSKSSAEKRKRRKQDRGFEENQQRIISESLEQRWQTIAGIKKRVV